ncbi:MAG: ISKra4 family transposase [Micromonosporaceae bacterium]
MAPAWAGPARGLFESVVSWLDGPVAMGADHAELEDRLAVGSREQYRLLLQGHLDERAARERRRSGVTGVDAVARTRVEAGHQRALATVFGQVRVTRKAYRALGAGNLYPGDAVLNLPVGKHSHGLRRLAALESARGSFERAGEAIGRVTGTRLGKRQIEQLSQAAAADVDAYYAGRRPGARPDSEVLVLQADGKGIVMCPAGLREATARTAAAATGKLATRLSPGEKRGRKRMAEIGAVHDLTPAPRTPDDIIPAPGRRGRSRPRDAGPAATGKWLTASITDDIPAVIATLFDEAERRDPDHARVWVALVDGNPQQIKAIQAQAAARAVTVTIVIDFVHVLEYVWKAAWTFFYSGDPDAETWVATHARKILQGQAVAVAAAIARQADLGGYSTEERKGVDTAAGYLTAKSGHLDYATALERGWPIATGVIEGACRHLVKDRMDITGARWGRDGAEAILKLRALISNGDFEDYWQHHLQQEHHRNHQTHYQDPVLAA